MEKNLASVSTAQNEEMFTPKHYNVRSGAIDSGKDYEIKVTALLALKCCSEDLQQFWLASNVAGFGALDDIIMFKRNKKNDQGVTYFLQLKHQAATKKLAKAMFLASQGHFSLTEYSKCYRDIIKTIIDITQKEDIIKHLQQVKKMVFIIFTNKGVYEEIKFLRKLSEASEIDIIQGQGNIFKIICNALPTSLELDKEFLENLFLFTNQLHISAMDNEINTAIKNLLPFLKLSDVELKDISLKFVSFITEWSKGLLGGYYPITKTLILKKLTELLLFPYIFKLQEPKDKKSDRETNKEQNENTTKAENKDDNEEDNIWYELTRDKDVTVIEEADEVVVRHVNNSIYNIVNNRNISDSKTAIKRALMRVVSSFENMSLSDTYELLWKTCQIPLLLQVSDAQSVKNIQEILKAFPKVFQVFIFNKTKDALKNLQASKPFINITDLNNKHQELILQLPIKLQGRNLSSIQKLNISNEQCFRSLMVKDIVHILSGKFNIGSNLEPLPNVFVEMSLTRIILDVAVLKQVIQDIFVVKCESPNNFKSRFARQFAVSEDQIIHWENLDKSNFADRIIIFDSIEKLCEIEEFCATLQLSVHFLSWHDNDNLEWIKSNNTTENLREYEKPFESTKIGSVLAEDALTNFCQYKTTLLVSANPGMGKTVLLNYFARNFPINFGVLKINLAEYKNHYENWDIHNRDLSQCKPEYFKQFLDQVLNDQQICNSNFYYLGFEQYLNSKNLVLLLDGFDEIPVECQDGAKELIRFIKESGYYTCVTTRPVLKRELESVLNTFAVTLDRFTLDKQIYFLTNYFANVGNIGSSNNKVVSFVTKLLEAARNNLNDTDNRFTGIPLQTTLLAELFAEDFVNYLDDEIFKNQYFDLMKLYKHFLTKKTEIADLKSVPRTMINQYKRCRLLYALRHVFSDRELKELKINEKLTATIDLFPDTMQIIQKDGIIVTDSESNVSFVHQMFAEIFVAEWLSENMNTPHKTIVLKLFKKTFDPNFTIVRNMFDRLLAKDCPLHTAIINHQITTVEEIIASDENSFITTNEGGRTILHLIAAWGLHHPHSFSDITCDMINDDDMMTILKLILNNKLTHAKDRLNYTPIDYAVLSRSLSIADKICSKVQNPICCINITKAEIDSILKYVDKYYSPSLFAVVLRCHIRADLELIYQGENGTSDLHDAIRKGCMENVFSLISTNNVNVSDHNGCTPLHIAAICGQTDIVRLLLEKANVNVTDNSGRSPLHWASYRGYLEIVSLLLSSRVEVTTTDCYDKTALYYSFLSSSTYKCDVASMLINSQISSSNNKTANFLEINK